jgi:hypothetical protein
MVMEVTQRDGMECCSQELDASPGRMWLVNAIVPFKFFSEACLCFRGHLSNHEVEHGKNNDSQYSSGQRNQRGGRFGSRV